MELLKFVTVCVFFLMLCQETRNQNIELNDNQRDEMLAEIPNQKRDVRNSLPEKVHTYEQPVITSRPQTNYKPLNLRLNPYTNTNPKKILAPVKKQATTKATQPVKAPFNVLSDNKLASASSLKDKPSILIFPSTQNEIPKNMMQKGPLNNEPVKIIATSEKTKEVDQKEHENIDLHPKLSEFYEDVAEINIKPVRKPKVTKQKEIKASIKHNPFTGTKNKTSTSNVSKKSRPNKTVKMNDHVKVTDPKTSSDITKNSTVDIKTPSVHLGKKYRKPKNETLYKQNGTIAFDRHDAPKSTTDKTKPISMEIQNNKEQPQEELITDNMEEVTKTPYYSGPKEITLESLILDKILGHNDDLNDRVKSKVNSNPTEQVKHESNDSIIIRNKKYEEIFERSTAPYIPDYLTCEHGNVEPYELTNWRYKEEVIPYKVDNSGGDNRNNYEARFQNPVENQMDVNIDEDVNYKINSRSNDKDRLWRSWKDTEIWINTSKKNPVNIEDGNINNFNDYNVLSGAKTPILNGMIQPVIGFDGCYRNQNRPAVSPVCFYSNPRYVYYDKNKLY